jgi:hypothetical protein
MLTNLLLSPGFTRFGRLPGPWGVKVRPTLASRLATNASLPNADRCSRAGYPCHRCNPWLNSVLTTDGADITDEEFGRRTTCDKMTASIVRVTSASMFAEKAPDPFPWLSAAISALAK